MCQSFDALDYRPTSLNLDLTFSKITYFSWNCTTGSAKMSLMSICLPLLSTFGCLFIISQPQCANQKPRFESCGSAFVSEYLWWTRWSRTQSKIVFCPEIEKQMARMILRGSFALYALCVHMRWTPPVTPNPAAPPTKNPALGGRNNENHCQLELK